MNAPPSPRIEEYVAKRAFERRAHVLSEKGTYRVRSSLGWVAYGGVLAAHLPEGVDGETVMWVDFIRHSQTGVSPEGKITVASRPEGEIAIAIGPREFATTEEIIKDNLATDYLREWVDKYWPPGQSSSFVERRHPAINAVGILRNYFNKGN